MIKIKHRGDFRKTEKFMRKMNRNTFNETLRIYGEMGVAALSAATPVDSGKTAASWRYSIEHNGDRHSLYFSNTHTNKGVNIAIILQYGHGTGTGGYVKGIDYINPALQEVFQQMADSLWREVQSA